EVSRFAGSFFGWFMAVQFTVVFLVTPAYTAGAIAEEKERRTLEFLLATELSDGEIVLGMLAARLGNLFLLILAGFALLSSLLFLGGVDPMQVFAGFAATAMTMLSLGSISILVSVSARTALVAIVTAYFFSALLVLGTGCFAPPLAPLFYAQANGTTFCAEPLPTDLLIGYSILHGLVALFCSWWAVSQLRPAAMGTI